MRSPSYYTHPGTPFRKRRTHKSGPLPLLAFSHKQVLDAKPTDLHEVLTDVVMPGLRSTELAQPVEEHRPSIHVIYISGYAQSLSEAQIPAGAAFRQKPFRFASLAEQLKLVPRKA